MARDGHQPRPPTADRTPAHVSTFEDVPISDQVCRKWLPSLARTEEMSEAALVCFPYAGGNAGAFKRWQAQLGPSIRVLPLQLPGRWTRLREPPVEDLAELIGTISAVISTAGLKQYTLYGHSFGALVAYEVTQRRIALSLSKPRALFVAAHPPPRLRPPPAPIHRRSDEDFLAALVGLDRPTARAGSRHFDRTIRSLKVDFRLSHDYQPSCEDPLPIPITAVAGRSDHFVDPILMSRWADETSAGFRCLEVDGDHFFVHEPPVDLLNALRAWDAPLPDPSVPARRTE